MEKGANVFFKYSENKLICSVSGEIDHHSAKTIREAVDKRLSEDCPDILIFDLEKISFMDSSGLGLVLGRYQKASEMGIEFKIEKISPVAKRMFDMAGLSRIINY